MRPRFRRRWWVAATLCAWSGVGEAQTLEAQTPEAQSPEAQTPETQTPAPGVATQRLLVATSAPRGPALAEALQAELAGRGWEVMVGPDAGEGATGLARAARAQELASTLGAAHVVWVEEGSAGASIVRAVSATGDVVRHAPFAGDLATVAPRTFASVAASLLDELRRPPSRARVRVRVRVEVEGEGVTIDGGSAEVRTRHQEARATLERRLAPTPAEPLPPPVPTHAPPDGTELREVAFGLDLLPYVGSSSVHRGHDRRAISLGLWSHAGAMDGFAGALALNTSREGIDGFAIAGGANITAGPGSGLLLAGAANWVHGPFEGGQLALGLNVAAGGLRGVQGLSVVNVVRGDLHGAQFAAGVNIVTGRLIGVQGGTGLNFARGGAGVQGGVVNVQRGSFDGLQIGLVNISEDADFALGIINVVRQGRLHLETTINTEGFVQTGIKHGGDHWHYVYSLITRPFAGGGNDPVVGVGMGIGGRLTPGARVFFDFDTVGHWMRDVDGGVDDGSEMLVQARALMGVRLTPRFALVAGASYNVSGSFDGSRYGTFGEQLFGVNQTYLDDRPLGRPWSIYTFPSFQLGFQVL